MKKPIKKKHHGGRHRNAIVPTRSRSRSRRNARTPPSESKSLTAKIKADPASMTTLKVLGGAGVTGVACALGARNEVLSPTWLTAIVGGVGAVAGVIGRNDTIRSVGNGMASAASAQLGLLLIDNHYNNAAKKQEPAPPPKKRDAEGLPPGALEAAYERARRRMALSEAASKMAA